MRVNAPVANVTVYLKGDYVVSVEIPNCPIPFSDSRCAAVDRYFVPLNRYVAVQNITLNPNVFRASVIGRVTDTAGHPIAGTRLFSPGKGFMRSIPSEWVGVTDSNSVYFIPDVPSNDDMSICGYLYEGGYLHSSPLACQAEDYQLSIENMKIFDNQRTRNATCKNAEGGGQYQTFQRDKKITL